LLAARPLAKYNFAFHGKRDFWDVIHMRYSLEIRDIPTKCACGADNSFNHTQNCATGGFLLMRHDQPKNLFAKACKSAYIDVGCEPSLEPLTGEIMKYQSAITTDNARSDVRCRSFWTMMRNAFFEFRVFNPFAKSYSSKTPKQCYRLLAQTRRREYEQRIREVDDGDFTPMIISSTGGMGEEMQIALKHLAQKIAIKNDQEYAHVITMMRCNFSFAMARASIICLRGSKSI
jgi:hypothetical protein